MALTPTQACERINACCGTPSDGDFKAIVASLLCGINTAVNTPPLPGVDTELVLLCDPVTGDKVYVRYEFNDQTGAPIQTAAFNIDGTPYAGAIGTLAACDDTEAYVVQYTICDTGVQKIVRICFANCVPISATYLNVDLTPSTVPADFTRVTIGECAKAQTFVELGCLQDATFATRQIEVIKIIAPDGAISVSYAELDGTAITPVGTDIITLGQCDNGLVVENEKFCAIVDDLPNYAKGDKIAATFAVRLVNTNAPVVISYKNLSNGTYPMPFYLQKDGVDIIGSFPNPADFGDCPQEVDVLSDCDTPIYVKSVDDKIEAYHYNTPEVTTVLAGPPPWPNNWTQSIDGGLSYLPWDGAQILPSEIGPCGNRFRMTHRYECAVETTFAVGGRTFDLAMVGNPDGRGTLTFNGVVIARTPTDPAGIVYPITTIVGDNIFEFCTGLTMGGAIRPNFYIPDSYTCVTPASCSDIQKITNCDGVVNWVDSDGNPYTPTGLEIPGVCKIPLLVNDHEVEILCDDNGSFLRRYVVNSSGTVTTVDTILDGVTNYSPIGVVKLCSVGSKDVETQILCDLDPSAAPNDQGLVCATRFIRTYIYNADGTLDSTADHDFDGAPYTPVSVVDCNGGTPSLEQVEWPRTDFRVKPLGADPTRNFEFETTNPRGGATALIGFDTVTPINTVCGTWGGPGTIPGIAAQGGNPASNTRFTFTLSPEALLASTIGIVFTDLDTFEGVRSLSPPPDRVEFPVGAGAWLPGGNAISATVNNSTAIAYWDTPPPVISHLYRNMGGGTACHSPDVRLYTLEAGPCCAGCGGGGSSPVETPWTTTNFDSSRIEVNTPTAASTPAGLQSVAFTGIAGAHGEVLVNGVALLPGETVEYEAYQDPVTRVFRRVDAIPYATAGAGHLHISLVP